MPTFSSGWRTSDCVQNEEEILFTLALAVSVPLISAHEASFIRRVHTMWKRHTGVQNKFHYICYSTSEDKNHIKLMRNVIKP